MIELEWGDEEKTFIYSRFHPNWTWAEFTRNSETYYEMVQSVPWRVDYIADFRGVSIIPSNMVFHTQRMFTTRLANEGYIIIIDANPIVRQLVDFISRVVPSFGRWLIFTKTIEQAHNVTKLDRNDHGISQV